MRNYIFRKGLVLGIILLFVGASILPIVSGDEFESSFSSNINTRGDRDQIDQYQRDIENIGQIFRDNIWVAQSIKPIYTIQTRANLVICKHGSPPNDALISLRDSLSGPDLTSIAIPKEQIPSYPGILWLEANYDDVQVTPQQTYYIVARTTGGDDSNYYYWYGYNGDPYTEGDPWYSLDYGVWWGVIYFIDHSFETYGRENLPPFAPTIIGPASGRPGETIDYTFNALDGDADDLRFIIDWGDSTSETTDYVSSGDDKIVSHTWTAGGSFTITVKAEDVFGMQGPVSTKVVTMPKNKATQNSMFNWFLEIFPNSFTIIRQLFGY